MSLTKCKMNASTGTYSYSIIIENTTHICFLYSNSVSGETQIETRYTNTMRYLI